MMIFRILFACVMLSGVSLMAGFSTAPPVDVALGAVSSRVGAASRGGAGRAVKGGVRGQAHLIDFGSARQWHADLTSAHGVQFSPSYAPPEQHLESERRSPATDLYSLAALAYTLLTGLPPTAVHDRLA